MSLKIYSNPGFFNKNSFFGEYKTKTNIQISFLASVAGLPPGLARLPSSPAAASAAMAAVGKSKTKT